MGTLPAIVGITAGGEWVEVVPTRREWTCLPREIRISMGHGIDERMLGWAMENTNNNSGGGLPKWIGSHDLANRTGDGHGCTTTDSFPFKLQYSPHRLSIPNPFPLLPWPADNQNNHPSFHPRSSIIIVMIVVLGSILLSFISTAIIIHLGTIQSSIF